MRIVLTYHLGSGNRGCEGIARGISNIFHLNNDELIMYDISDYDYQSDLRLGINKIGELKYKGGNVFEFFRLICRVLKKVGIRNPYYHLLSNYYLHDLGTGDVVFITGGDIYCYKGEYVLPNMIVKKSKRKGIKTVLFGVSIEDQFLNSIVIDGLRLYDLIITRETISSTNLTKMGLKNHLYPDPAFSLTPEECILPDYFRDKGIVGINFSTFTNKSGLFKENMEKLISYITSKGMKVCLIPHVFWKEQDDRITLNEYKELFGDNVQVLDSEKLSYLQIRYVISKCKYFIGGRTHSVISAYCTHTPCIALGYSVKANGIAHDIGMPEYTLIDSKHLPSADTLLDAFKKLEQGKQEIMDAYDQLDSYVKKTFDAAKKVRQSLK